MPVLCVAKAQLKDAQHDTESLAAARDEAVNASKEADRKHRASEAELRQLQDDLASSERARKTAQSERDDLLEELNSGSSARLLLYIRGVHGNWEDWVPWDSHGNGSKISHAMGMGIKCMGMGVKTWKLSPATVNSLLFLHSNMK